MTRLRCFSLSGGDVHSVGCGGTFGPGPSLNWTLTKPGRLTSILQIIRFNRLNRVVVFHATQQARPTPSIQFMMEIGEPTTIP